MTRATVDEAKAVKVAIPKDASMYSVISETLARLPAMRYMDRGVVHDATSALLDAFGLQDEGSFRMPGDPAPFCGPDAQLLKAVHDLLTWTPEGAYSEHFGEFAVKCEDARYYFLQGPSTDRAEQAAEYTESVRDAPFLSQIVTYPVLGGKFDGRGIMARVDALRRLVGLSDD